MVIFEGGLVRFKLYALRLKLKRRITETLEQNKTIYLVYAIGKLF